jgi:hypothetical protein
VKKERRKEGKQTKTFETVVKCRQTLRIH